MKSILLFALTIQASAGQFFFEGELPAGYAAVRQYKCAISGSCVVQTESDDGTQMLFVRTRTDTAWRFITSSEHLEKGGKFFAFQTLKKLHPYLGELRLTSTHVFFTVLANSQHSGVWDNHSAYAVPWSGGIPTKILAKGDMVSMKAGAGINYISVSSFSLASTEDGDPFFALVNEDDGRGSIMTVELATGRKSAIDITLPKGLKLLRAWPLGPEKILVQLEGPLNRVTSLGGETYIADLAKNEMLKIGGWGTETLGVVPYACCYITPNGSGSSFLLNDKIGTIDYSATDRISTFDADGNGSVVIVGELNENSVLMGVGDYIGDFALVTATRWSAGNPPPNKVMLFDARDRTLKTLVDPAPEFGIRVNPRGVLLGSPVDMTNHWLMTVASPHGEAHIVFMSKNADGNEHYRLAILAAPFLDEEVLHAEPGGDFTLSGSNLAFQGSISRVQSDDGKPLACRISENAAYCTAPEKSDLYSLSVVITFGSNELTTNSVRLVVSEPKTNNMRKAVLNLSREKQSRHSQR